MTAKDFVVGIPDGWEEVPTEVITVANMSDAVMYWNRKGHMFLATIRETPNKHILASIGVTNAMSGGKTEKQLIEEGIKLAPELLVKFFGDRTWFKSPEDVKHPSMKHYHSNLNDERN